MSDPSDELLLSDSSSLINFLRVGRRDLLTGLPYRLLVTDVVRREILERYQSEELEAGIASGEFSEVSIAEIPQQQAAARLVGQGLGAGESISIVAADALGAILALDDRKAIATARRVYPRLTCLTTQDLVLENIRQGTLTVEDADALKDEWRAHHRFALKIKSFADLLAP